MVRHEAAEALGGIATPEVLPLLKEWQTRGDAPRVVRESCEVALDMYEVSVVQARPFVGEGLTPMLLQYENSGEFQYADGLEATSGAAAPVAAAA